ncbi:hypothetical protein ABEB36_004256 [Hypothenemus hampei]|uniref:rhamnogalacturonan endolyase n=1 Tax=Hypothenemus hampei TaxID=57062 RepID=A0ABD1F2R1_HYPHA
MALFSFLLITFLFVSFNHAKVTLKTSSDLAVEISNDLVKFNFKSDSTISSLHVNEEDIVHGASRSFYLDWTGSDGEFRFSPSTVEIVEQTDTRAHFYWTQDSSRSNDALNIELHYILEDGLSGIYCYAKYFNDKSSNVSFGETRMVYRFNPNLLVIGTNQVHTGIIPTSTDINESKKVQDATYEFPNGTYYTKYDFVVYIRETQYQGVYGQGYGAFIISPSREYHGGGPMKQDLTVHDYALVTNYFLSGHFGASSFIAPPGWIHFYGPFLLHLPTGKSDNEIIASVENQVKAEQEKWPYKFVSDDEYPLERGSVKGTVTGQKSATITLFQSTINEVFDIQQMGYLYTTNTDASGNYIIDKVRPGSYKIYAYPIAGLASENLVENVVQVTANSVQTVDFNLPELENIVWSLGQANRRANEFRLADQPRNYKWQLDVPTELNFTIGKSDPKVDWYYSQSHAGTWSIHYTDKQDGKSRILRIAIAGASKSVLAVTLNGKALDELSLDNDASIYRSAMQSGKFHFKMYSIESSLVVNGENYIDLTVKSGAVMYDALSLQIHD